MTVHELLNRVKEVIDRQTGVAAEVYFVIEKRGNLEVVRADIESSVQDDIFRNFKESLLSSLVGDELTLQNISQADGRRAAVYRWDLGPMEGDIAVACRVPDHTSRQFDFQSDKYQEVFGLLIKLGSRDLNLTVFQKTFPISVVKKDSVFSLSRLGNSSRMTRLDRDYLKITFGSDFLMLDGEVFVLNEKPLERFFNFHETVKRMARSYIPSLEQSGLLASIEGFDDDIASTSFARKVIRCLGANRVLGVVPRSKIFAFAKNHPRLSAIFRFDEPNELIIANTKKARSWVLKMLNDDLLVSQLTETLYDSVAKDTI